MKSSHASENVVTAQESPADLARATLRACLDLAALGSLMRAFAHDANNRLMVIMSCLDVLSLNTLDEHDQSEALALASGASQQLAEDLGILLAGARAQLARPQRVELADELQTAIELYEFMNQHTAPVAVVARSRAGVLADATQLQPALLRLLLGAERLGATAVTARVLTFDSAELAGDWPMLRKGRYAGVEFECVGATIPQRLVRDGSVAGHTLDLLRDPDGLEFACVEAYAHAMRGALDIRRDGAAQPRIRLLLPLQD